MRLFAAILLTALVACGLLIGSATWILQSPARTVAVAQWGVEQFSNLRLEFDQPQLTLGENQFAAAAVRLFQQDNSTLPLIVIHDFQAELDPGKVFGSRLRNARLQASNLTIYVATTDSTEDPGPASWLRYLQWLPGSLAIGSVHLIRHGEELLVFPLTQLQGQLQGADTYRLHATAQYEEEPLDTTIHLYAMHNERGLRGVQLRVDLHATRSARVAVLEGELLGGVEDFSYDLSLNAAFPDIRLLAARDAELKGLNGALQLRGRLRGDLNQFQLSDAEIGLFHAPEYEFIATGSFAYKGPDDNLLEAHATGHMEQLGLLLDWLNIDLSSFGSARAALDLQGPIGALAVPRFELRTQHHQGLQLSLEGSLGPGALTRSGSEQPRNTVRLRAAGPGLSVLEQWLGEVPIDPGPWEIEGQLSGARDQITLTDIRGHVGAPDTTRIELGGRIGQLSTSPPITPASVQDVALELTASANTLQQINQWWDTGLSTDHQVSARATLNGSAEQLQLDNLFATLASSDASLTLAEGTAVVSNTPQWQVKNLKGRLSAELSDTSALSQYLPVDAPVLGAVQLSGNLAQHNEALRLTDLQGGIDSDQLQLNLTGGIGNLATLADTRINIAFSRLDIRNLIHAVQDNFSYPRALGQISGKLELRRSDGHWHLPAFDVTSDANSNLKLKATGVVSDLLENPAGTADIFLAVTDRELLRSVSGRDLPGLQASLKAEASSGQVRVSGTTTLATTRLQLQAELQHRQREIHGLALKLESPAVTLSDLGLQADDATPETSRKKADAQQGSLDDFVQSLPSYPLDLQLHLGTVRGERIDLKSVDIAVDGSAGRYLLRQLNMRGSGSQLELAGIIDLSARPPALSLGGQALSLDMRQVIQDLGLSMDVAGILSLRGGFSARGNHSREWLSSLDGNISVAMKDVEIQGAAYDLLATDLLAWVYSGAALEQSTHVDCTMASFTLRSGIANSENLFAESPRMVATGKGRFDLVRETLDVRITPLSKSRMLQIPSSVTLTGSLSKPRTWISPIAATADASAEALMLIPSLTMKLLGLRRDDKAPVRPCEALPPV